MTTTVGIEIGGSSLRAVVLDDDRKVVDSHETVASFSSGHQVVDAAISAYRALDPVDCIAVGIGIPGRVNRDHGHVSFAINLGIGAEPFPLASQIGAQLGLPVFIENDVRAAALGIHETITSRGDVPNSLALVSIGTGVSAGVVVDGSLIRGAHGMAGEIGHVVIDENGPVCRCGQRGCLEALVSGPAIGRAWPKGATHAAATALFAAAANGDRPAETVAARITDHLTTALIWLAAAYDTELILLGGGVSSAGDDFLAAMRKRIAERGAASQFAARRLRPEQVVLVDPLDLPGARGAALIAATSDFQNAGPARTASKQHKASKQQGGTV